MRNNFQNNVPRTYFGLNYRVFSKFKHNWYDTLSFEVGLGPQNDKNN